MGIIKFAETPSWLNIIKFGESEWYTVIVIEVALLIALAAWRILLEDDTPVQAPVSDGAATVTQEEPKQAEEDSSLSTLRHRNTHRATHEDTVSISPAKKSNAEASAPPPTPEGRRSGRPRTPNRQRRSPSPARAPKSDDTKKRGARSTTPGRKPAVERSPTPSKRAARK